MAVKIDGKTSSISAGVECPARAGHAERLQPREPSARPQCPRLGRFEEERRRTPARASGSSASVEPVKSSP